jgi:chromosome segregation ATPase
MRRWQDEYTQLLEAHGDLKAQLQSAISQAERAQERMSDMQVKLKSLDEAHAQAERGAHSKLDAVVSAGYIHWMH